ncbi:MAG: serine hydrolase domain-containing protein [Planctomycetota bacterium]|jgi:CubicO group peptidase (beta-lactamase class C family)
MARLQYATPAELNLDGGRLETAFELLHEWTAGDDAPIPGGAILVGRHGRIVEPRFFGRQGPNAGAGEIRRDGMFLLASITKPITYLAAMMLVEQGRLNLSDPVMRHIPEFAAHHKEDTLVLHLFTHTSGMPDMLDDNAELRAKHAPLERFIEGAINAMPLFPAGTDYSYQSMGTLIVAELVQRLSGMSIRDFVRKEILAPLGLESTGLGSIGLDRERLVRVQTPEYQAGSNFGWNSRYWQELGAPWGAMFSAPEDFAVICQMLLNGGSYGDVRLLSPGTVNIMTTNRLDDQPDLPEPVRRAKPWGLGWKLNPRGTASSFGATLGPNVFGHTGATGTMCWIDPDREGFCLLFTTAIRSRAPWRLVHLSNIVGSAFL